MHETDAMKFIEPVFLGFLSRQFDFREGEDPSRYEPHIQKIQSFIQDKEPHWVKEKALFLIEDIEYAEISIHTGRYTPNSPEAFLNVALDRVRKKLEGFRERYRLEENPGKMSVFVTLPSLPQQK